MTGGVKPEVEMVESLPSLGYVDQPRSNVDLVNRNKVMEEHVLRIIDELQANDSIDKRWLAIGKTNLEQAFMAINRSIFKPVRIS